MYIFHTYFIYIFIYYFSYIFLFYFYYILYISISLGFISIFVEIFAWVMTIPAYCALHQILKPDINPYGWGYDFWYENYAKKNVIGTEMKKIFLLLNFTFLIV